MLYKAMTKGIQSLFQACGFSDADANLRQFILWNLGRGRLGVKLSSSSSFSTRSCPWGLRVANYIYNKTVFELFPLLFLLEQTAELLPTRLFTGIATSSCNTGSVATTYKATNGSNRERAERPLRLPSSEMPQKGPSAKASVKIFPEEGGSG